MRVCSLFKRLANPHFLQARSKEGNPPSSTKEMAKELPIPEPRGKLIIGLFAEREEGRRGATPKEFLRSTAALGAKLEHTKTARTKKESLSLPVLAAAVNRIFKLCPGVINGGRKLTVNNIRRRAYNEDNYVPKKNGKKTETTKVIWSYMGVPYEELDGNNADQMFVYRRHVNATGLSDLIDWLIELVLIEVTNPISAKEINAAAKKAAKAKKAKANRKKRDSLERAETDEDDFEALDETKAKVKARVFTAHEKKAFKIEIDGINALNQTADGKFVIATENDVANRCSKRLKLPIKVEESSETVVVKKEQVEEPTKSPIYLDWRQNVPSPMVALNKINSLW